MLFYQRPVLQWDQGATIPPGLRPTAGDVSVEHGDYSQLGLFPCLWTDRFLFFYSTEAFSIIISNKLTVILFKVSLLYVCCKSFQPHTHRKTETHTLDAVKQMLHTWFVLALHRDLSRNEIRVIHRDAFLTLNALTNLWVWPAIFYHVEYWMQVLQRLVWLSASYRILK